MRETLVMSAPELYPWPFERWNILLGIAALALGFGFALTTGRIPTFLRSPRRLKRRARRAK